MLADMYKKVGFRIKINIIHIHTNIVLHITSFLILPEHKKPLKSKKKQYFQVNL